MIFKDNWYSTQQLEYLKVLASMTNHLEGLILDIGVWEGKSTIGIAHAVYPHIITAVDHFKGNTDESRVTNKTHISEELARIRDVHKEFVDNMEKYTRGNYILMNEDCFEYLRTLNSNTKIKFVHIDASHDYFSVKNTLLLLLPLMVENGVICGDDYVCSNSEELHGGVKRACDELLPNHYSIGNLFYWVNSKEDNELTNGQLTK